MKRGDIRGLGWADIKSNESKKMPQAHDGAGVASARSFLHLGSEGELRRVAGLLPSRQSSIENIVAELLAIGGRYHRNLHQDEFGPTRAERMQALRDLLVRLGVLSSRLEALPPQLQSLLSERFLECRSAAGQLDVDPVAFYSADKTAVDVVSETASDVRHTLTSSLPCAMLTPDRLRDQITAVRAVTRLPST